MLLDEAIHRVCDLRRERIKLLHQRIPGIGTAVYVGLRHRLAHGIVFAEIAFESFQLRQALLVSFAGVHFPEVIEFLLETAGVRFRFCEPVVKALLRPSRRDVGEPLLHLDGVKLHLLGLKGKLGRLVTYQHSQHLELGCVVDV